MGNELTHPYLNVLVLLIKDVINIQKHIISEAFEQLQEPKNSQKIFPNHQRYRGYLIITDRSGDGYNVYNKDRELEDEGFASVNDAKKFINELCRKFRESKLVENDKFDVRKLTPKDIEEMRKFIKNPKCKGLSVQ